MNGEPTYDPDREPYGPASETPRDPNATPFPPSEVIPPAPGYWDLLSLVLFAVPAFALIFLICTVALFGLNFVFG